MESKEYEYITIGLVARGHTTNMYHVINKRTHACLGVIRWYGAWRQYCFYPTENVIFSSGCMLDVCDFIKGLMHDHRVGLSKRGRP